MTPLKIVIADDHGVVRDGLKMLLDGQPDMAVVGEVDNAYDVVARAEETGCDVVLLDISMPGESLEQIPVVHERCPNARVLVLTMHDNAEHRRRARRAGAAGYVVKRSASSDLLTAIRGPNAAVAPTPPMGSAAIPKPPATPLSPREREVLRMISGGFTNQEAADHLGVSIKTVEGYRARVRKKLKAKSRVDLVRCAIELGLLDPGRG